MRYLKLFEEFVPETKDELYDWLYSKGILRRGEVLNPETSVKVVKYFLHYNSEIIKKTALSDCHAIGLNSFILNESPKIRLFICDNDSELYSSYNPERPIIPIHPHKYDDLFFPINGKLIHHLYTKNSNGIEFNKYHFIRLSNVDMEIKNLGTEKLKYVGYFNSINKLKSKALHTVSVEDKDTAWLIMETNQDMSFNEIFYHHDLKPRPDLYQKKNNPIEFIEDFLIKIGKK
jgi:hypothetical protein